MFRKKLNWRTLLVQQRDLVVIYVPVGRTILVGGGEQAKVRLVHPQSVRTMRAHGAIHIECQARVAHFNAVGVPVGNRLVGGQPADFKPDSVIITQTLQRRAAAGGAELQIIYPFKQQFVRAVVDDVEVVEFEVEESVIMFSYSVYWLDFIKKSY